MVAREHPANLRHRGVRFVHEHQRVFRKEIEQRVRRLARFSARQCPAVVLDPRAVADLLEHFQIEPRAGRQTLCFEQLPFAAEVFEPRFQFTADLVEGRVDPLLRQHEVFRRVDVDLFQSPHFGAGERVDLRQAFDFIPPQLDAIGELFVSRPALDHVAAHAEPAADEIEIVSLVLNVDQPAQHLVAVDTLADAQRDHHFQIILGGAEPVQAAYRGDDNHVPPAHERTGRGQPQPLDLFVDRGILLDIDVALRDVRFGLIVIEVADEIRHRVVRKELAELAVKLRRQRLVVRKYERRPLRRLDDVRHRERLPRTGDAQQHLVALPFIHAAHERSNRGRLISGGLKFGRDLKLGHQKKTASKDSQAESAMPEVSDEADDAFKFRHEAARAVLRQTE
jgi:hypothetical protein